MNEFYYSKGKRITVSALNSAYVAVLPDDRAKATVAGWRSVSLGTKGLAVFVKEDLVTQRNDLLTLTEIIKQLSECGVTNPKQEQHRSLLSSLRQNISSEALPVLINDSGHILFPTGEVTLQLKSGVSPEQLSKIAQEKNFRILRTIPYISNGIVVQAQTGEDGVDLARILVESGIAIFAEPNFIEQIPDRLFGYPSNSYFPKQWHLNNTGQGGANPGVDICAIRAWEISTGSPTVCIAIIDSGVDLTHEAFNGRGKVVAPFDFEDNDHSPTPVESSHGTSCAGIAVAPINRGNVVGVAPDCTVMPIRRGSLSEHLKMADAFAWAADNGADVINCSFGYDNKPWPQPEIVSLAVEYAATHGRNGKGCVIVWAAGNGSEDISSDEWASNKHVLAVSAITDKNERASYSDYGAEVAVCAPSNGGINGITTTTIGGYTNSFGGTSAAAPIVAGVAALVLSINPNLRQQEVRDVICISADKVDITNGNYDQNTGHSAWYGYGRVNAYKAMLAIDVLREAARGDFNIEISLGTLRTFRDKVLLSSDVGTEIDIYLRKHRFSILHLLVNEPSTRIKIQNLLRWLISVYPSLESNTPIYGVTEIIRICGELVPQITLTANQGVYTIQESE